MWTSNLNLKLIVLAVGLAWGSETLLASNYQPFPDTTPGALYHWKSYLVDEHGKRSLRGIYTNTIEGKTLIGEHEYTVVQVINPEHKALPSLIYRCDDNLFGMILGNDERSLLVHWKGTPSAGQAWTRGTQKVVIRGQEDVAVEGVAYPGCWVLDQFDNGELVNRSWFSRDAGWVQSSLYKEGRMTATGYRVPEGNR